MVEYNVRKLEDNQVVILNKIKLGSNPNPNLFIQVSDEVADKFSDVSMKYVYDTKTGVIIENSKCGGFDGFPAGSKKEHIALELRKYLNSRMDAWSSVNMIFYVENVLQLADAGYIITDKNREEKYLEILETGDEYLIDLLEYYLNAKDDMSPIISYRKLYNETKLKLLALEENDPELDNILKKVL